MKFTPEQEQQLTVIAGRTGKPSDELVRDAIAHLLEDETQFVKAVEEGLASLDQGRFLTHEQVGTRIQQLFPD